MRSKLRKAIFTSAILSMAVLSSCGGGGSSDSSSSNSSPPTPPGPITSSTVKLLAQTVSGSNYQDYQVNICDLKPDGTISCGNDLNPTPKTANIRFDYGISYEFSNGNVLLIGSDGKAYYFDSATGTINKLTNGKDVTENVLSDQLDFRIYNTGFPKENPNFTIHDGNDPSKGYIVITKSGKYVVNTGGDINKFYYMGDDSDFVVVTDNVNHRTYRIDTDGNVSEIKDNDTSIEFQTLLAKIGDNILVKATNSAVYFLRDNGTIAKLVPSTSSDTVDARMIKVGSDFYIAVRNGKNLYYYKNNIALLKDPITIHGGDLTSYALDGSGNLYYYILDSDIGVGVVTTNSQILPMKVVSSYDGLIGTSVGVIALDNYKKKVELLSITGNSIVSNAVSAGSNPDLFNAVSTCMDAKRNEPDVIYSHLNGEGTNQIMCVGNAVTYGSSVSSLNFSWITYDNNNVYNVKQIPITDIVDYIEFYNNKTIIYTRPKIGSTDPYKIKICSAGSTTCATITGLSLYEAIKRYVKNNNYILGAAVQTSKSPEKYAFYIADLFAGTSKQVFTDLSTYLIAGNVSLDISMAAIVSNSSDSSCPNGYGNIIQLYNNGVYSTYKSNKLCFYKSLLKLYKQ